MNAYGDSRAASITGPGRIEVTHRPVPQPGPGEVRVRLLGCGICASNLPVWQGRDWFEYPLEAGAPGHEGWGEVDALGEGAEGLAVGDLVTMLSYHAYAEHDIARVHELVQLPEAFRDYPFPGEPLACAMNILERSSIEAGHTVAVVGVGFLGALLTQLAKGRGARVIALSRRRYSLEVAETMGADECICVNDSWQAAEEVRRLTDGLGCERVIEAAGLQSTLDLASQLTAQRGRLIIAGFHQDGPRQVDLQHWNWLGLDVINAHERQAERYVQGMHSALAAIREGSLDPTPLFTHSFALDQLEEGFRSLDSRPDGFVKGLLML
jgi:NADPH:quinone reductase